MLKYCLQKIVIIHHKTEKYENFLNYNVIIYN